MPANAMLIGCSVTTLNAQTSNSARLSGAAHSEIMLDARERNVLRYAIAVDYNSDYHFAKVRF
jgi:hypothetical protein